MHPAAPLGPRSRAEVMEDLRRLLPRLEGGRDARALPFGLPALDAHLPHGGLALGALHEVVPATKNDLPAAFGFMAALLGRVPGEPVLLVTARRFADHGSPYGHGLNAFGLDPARLILVETEDDRELLWTLEETLRSGVPAAVAGAIAGLDLKTSQRLQLAARDSRIPLLLLRSAIETSAAVTRWRIGTAEAARDDFGLIARARWRVRLERCRNGRLGEWLMEFDHAAYRFSLAAALADPALPRRAGAQWRAHAGRS
jgi:protein ImuA